MKSLDPFTRKLLVIAAIAIGGVPVASAQTLTLLVPASCASNNPIQYLYTKYQADVGTIPERTAALGVTRPANITNPNFQPILDIRYVNDITDYPNSGDPTYADHLTYTGIAGSVSGANTSDSWAVGTTASRYDGSGTIVQKKCVNGYLVFGAMVNGWDSPVQQLTFGGPNVALTYKFQRPSPPGFDVSPVQPWTSTNGNLMLQAYFIPAYHYGAIRGEAGFNVFLQHVSNPTEYLNYVINVYRSDGAADNETEPATDPTTGAWFVGTGIRDARPDGSAFRWTTKSPYSASSTDTRDYGVSTESWPQFFRVNISRNNLQQLLTATGKTSAPEEWAVKEVSFLWEIGGSPYSQALAGSLQAFETYQSDGPV